MTEEEKDFSLEEGFAGLEEILGRLEDEELPLEDAFREYSRGMLLLKACSEKIDTVEKQVLKLTGEGQLEEFENE